MYKYGPYCRQVMIHSECFFGKLVWTVTYQTKDRLLDFTFRLETWSCAVECHIILYLHNDALWLGSISPCHLPDNDWWFENSIARSDLKTTLFRFTFVLLWRWLSNSGIPSTDLIPSVLAIRQITTSPQYRNGEQLVFITLSRIANTVSFISFPWSVLQLWIFWTFTYPSKFFRKHTKEYYRFGETCLDKAQLVSVYIWWQYCVLHFSIPLNSRPKKRKKAHCSPTLYIKTFFVSPYLFWNDWNYFFQNFVIFRFCLLSFAWRLKPEKNFKTKSSNDEKRAWKALD